MNKNYQKIRLSRPTYDDFAFFDSSTRNLAENPLLQYSLSDVKKERHHRLLKQRAAQTKIKIAREPDDNLEPIRPEKQSYYIGQLRARARKASVPTMLETIEEKIRDVEPDPLEAKYPEAVKSYMDEVKEDYARTMDMLNMRRILVPPELEDKDFENFKFKKPNEYYRSCEFQNYIASATGDRRLSQHLKILPGSESCCPGSLDMS